MNATSKDKISLYMSVAIATVLVLLPFHAFFTTWVGSNTGHLDLVRIWKELIIAALIPGTLFLISKSRDLRTWFWQSWISRLIFLYALLHLVFGLLALRGGLVNSSALIYGLLANLRFLGFFLIVLVAGSQTSILKQYWKHILLIPAAIVVGFGVLQRFILPYDFLRHFGYGSDTIPAFQTVDQKLDYRRIQSTLRGANPLGAYLVLILPVFALIKRQALKICLLISAFIVLFFSFSRSAWIGAIIMTFVYAFLSVNNVKLRKQIIIVMTLCAVIVGLGIVAYRSNRVVQNTFFHTDNTSTSSVSSNSGRAAALESGLNDVLKEPFGRGPGTAGPASVRNNHPARISENYYLQIAQEIGWIGLGLFASILGLIIKQLWDYKKNQLNKILIATLIGISFINLLSHAWMDDTLGLLWWGLAGVAVSSDILIHKHVSSKKASAARS